MKHTVIVGVMLALASLFFILNTKPPQKFNAPVYTQSQLDSAMNAARWREKMRWMQYQLDSIDPQVQQVLKDLLDNKISDAGAWMELIRINHQTTTPYDR